MEHPKDDLKDRSEIWDYMQMFWMDTDPGILLDNIAEACFKSKYLMNELEHIFWNEVRPAVSFNLLMLPAPEWSGFEISWLENRILKKHKFGKRLPIKFLHRYSNSWWQKLKKKIENLEQKNS